MDLQDVNMDNNMAVDCKVLVDSCCRVLKVYMSYVLYISYTKVLFCTVDIPPYIHKSILLKTYNLPYIVHKYKGQGNNFDDTKVITPYLNLSFYDIIFGCMLYRELSMYNWVIV
ncbi:hypothetical protein COL82_19180 [Bacillus toyonensis]|nr:hypothetical protein COL82_19180 [Bacillus toyonensis]